MPNWKQWGAKAAGSTLGYVLGNVPGAAVGYQVGGDLVPNTPRYS